MILRFFLGALGVSTINIKKGEIDE